ncbi:MAG: DUF5752 family protein [Candidatus Woesearchaeota archaeon]
MKNSEKEKKEQVKDNKENKDNKKDSPKNKIKLINNKKTKKEPMANKNYKDNKKIKDARPEHYFILVTGVPLKNIKELALALETMDEWVFNHHVNHHRNDFATWIKDIFNEEALAEELKEIKNIQETERKLLKHLVSKYL